jgi:hypothetical protein
MWRGIALGAVGVATFAVAAGRPGQAAAAAPSAVTGGAISISPSGATLNGTVNPNGEATSVFFEYGAGGGYGSVTPRQEIEAGAVGPQGVAAGITNLAFGTIYHYRVVAENPSGRASGDDRALRTDDAVISGRYAVRLSVVRGGRVFGQHRGLTVRRPYRFRASCANGSCMVLRLRRRGATGYFSSKLTRRAGDRYKGVERSRGHCDNGSRFRARASLLLYARSLNGARAGTIAGKLHVRVGGCVKGGELATFTGRLVGHG